MRKLIALLLLATLVAGLNAPATAAKKKPVRTTLYLHGAHAVGEGGMPEHALDETVMPMDTKKPSDGTPKSRSVGLVAGNEDCTGNTTYFPAWVGNLAGTIVGDAKLTIHTLSPGATIRARIWVDTPEGLCNESYIKPAQEVSVAAPAGQGVVTIKFKKLKLKATSIVMIQVLRSGIRANFTRVLYDSTDAASKLEFSCIPARGKKCA